MINFKAPSLHKALGVPAGDSGVKLDKAKSANPILKKEGVLAKNPKGFSPPSAKAALGKIASSKPPQQTLSPVKSDRGNFKIKD